MYFPPLEPPSHTPLPDLTLDEDPLPGLQIATFLLYSHTAEKELWCLCHLIMALIPSRGVLHLITFRESIPRQVDKKSRVPEEEKGSGAFKVEIGISSIGMQSSKEQ